MKGRWRRPRQRLKGAMPCVRSSKGCTRRRFAKTPPPDSEIRISWVQSGYSSGPFAQNETCSSDQPDHKLIQALVRAHCCREALTNADFASIEELAASIKLHPKVVRNDIRLAFLAPEITESILTTSCALGLPELRKISVLSWQKQLDELNQSHP